MRRKYWYILATVFVLNIVPETSQALNFEYVPEDKWEEGRGNGGGDYAHLVISGDVVFGDGDRFSEYLARHGDVRFVRIRRSPGGSLLEGIKIAEIIHERGLHVVVEGPAASAAAIISLGGSESVTFFDSSHFNSSRVLFHCAYLRGEQVCHAESTRLQAITLAKFTKISEEQWYNFLMSETTPAKVVPIQLSKLFSHWNCWTSGRTGTHCSKQ